MRDVSGLCGLCVLCDVNDVYGACDVRCLRSMAGPIEAFMKVVGENAMIIPPRGPAIVEQLESASSWLVLMCSRSCLFPLLLPRSFPVPNPPDRDGPRFLASIVVVELCRRACRCVSSEYVKGESDATVKPVWPFRLITGPKGSGKR
jgi:hypothetical protein